MPGHVMLSIRNSISDLHIGIWFRANKIKLITSLVVGIIFGTLALIAVYSFFPSATIFGLSGMGKFVTVGAIGLGIGVGLTFILSYFIRKRQFSRNLQTRRLENSVPDRKEVPIVSIEEVGSERYEREMNELNARAENRLREAKDLKREAKLLLDKLETKIVEKRRLEGIDLQYINNLQHKYLDPVIKNMIELAESMQQLAKDMLEKIAVPLVSLRADLPKTYISLQRTKEWKAKALKMQKKALVLLENVIRCTREARDKFKDGIAPKVGMYGKVEGYKNQASYYQELAEACQIKKKELEKEQEELLMRLKRISPEIAL